jgi:hypothetical protein
MPRKRGAPPGNLNALKHGFYSKQLKNAKADLDDLDAGEFSGLQDEITLLRVFTRRVVDLGQDVDRLDEALSLLRGLCLAATTLTRLLKTQHILASGDDDVTRAIRQALDELHETLGLQDNPPASP